MKAYKVEILVVDHDKLGADDIVEIFGEVRRPYADERILPRVMNIQTADIGAWSDNHPLNQHATASEEYKRLFAQEIVHDYRVPGEMAHDTLVNDQPVTPFPEYCVKWPCCKQREPTHPLENRDGFMTCPLCECSYGEVQ